MLKNILMTAGRHAVSIVPSLVLSVALARALGAAGRGALAMGLLVNMLMTTFLSLGVPAANAYFISRREVSTKEAWRTSLVMWGVSSVSGCALAGVLVHFKGDVLFRDVPQEVLWAGIAGFPSGLLQMHAASLLQGRERFGYLNSTLLIELLIRVVLTLVALLVFDGGPAAALWCHAAASLAGFGVTMVFVSGTDDVRGLAKNPDARPYWRRCLGYGWQAQLGENLSFLNYRADQFLTNHISGSVATGLYSVAVGLTEKVWLLSNATGTVMAPRISALRDDEDARLEITPRVAKLVWITTAAGCLVLFLLAEVLLVLLFGPEFRDGALALRILLPGVVFGAVARSASADLSGRGRVDLNLKSAVVVVFVNIVGNLILLPIYGIAGAALATTIAYGTNMVLKALLYGHVTGTRWYRLFVPNRDDWRWFVGLVRRVRAGAGPAR